MNLFFSGFGFVDSICQRGREQIEAKMKSLEMQAHSIAGISFCLGSPLEVSHVLFQRLKLEPPKEKNLQKKNLEQGSTSERGILLSTFLFF